MATVGIKNMFIQRKVIKQYGIQVNEQEINAQIATRRPARRASDGDACPPRPDRSTATAWSPDHREQGGRCDGPADERGRSVGRGLAERGFGLGNHVQKKTTKKKTTKKKTAKKKTAASGDSRRRRRARSHRAKKRVLVVVASPPLHLTATRATSELFRPLPVLLILAGIVSPAGSRC